MATIDRINHSPVRLGVVAIVGRRSAVGNRW
jgi:hypothetical protein